MAAIVPWGEVIAFNLIVNCQLADLRDGTVMATNNLGQQALMGKVVVSQAGPIAALGAGEQGQILRMALIQKTFFNRLSKFFWVGSQLKSRSGDPVPILNHICCLRC